MIVAWKNMAHVFVILTQQTRSQYVNGSITNQSDIIQKLTQLSIHHGSVDEDYDSLSSIFSLNF